MRVVAGRQRVVRRRWRRPQQCLAGRTKLAEDAFGIAETGVTKARELGSERAVAVSFAVAGCDD